MNVMLVATDRDVTRACTHLLPTGISTHLMALARGLVEEGHEVTLLTGRDERAGVDLSYRHEGGGGLRVVRLNREQIEAVNHGEGRVGRDIEAVLELSAPCVVAGHGVGGAVVARDIAAAAGVPFLVALHEPTVRLQPDTPDLARRRRLERDLLRDADRVTVLSRDEGAHVIAEGVRPDAVDVVHRLVDTTQFDVRGGRLPRSKRLRVVGVVDDHGPTSGLIELVRAVSLVPDVELLVVGGAAQGSAPDDQGLARAYVAARQLGVSERMHVVGRLSPVRLAETFRAADVVVSAPWTLGSGDHVLEAMACGRPVVASALGGARDLIDHGVTGLCVPPQSPQRLTDALRLVLCDAEQRSLMGQLGRRRVLDHFLPRHAVAASLASYDRALTTRGLTARAS